MYDYLNEYSVPRIERDFAVDVDTGELFPRWIRDKSVVSHRYYPAADKHEIIITKHSINKKSEAFRDVKIHREYSKSYDSSGNELKHVKVYDDLGYSYEYDQPLSSAAARRASSKSRSRRIVRDIALSNKWDWFVTFTFDKNKINRMDLNEVVTSWTSYIKSINRSRSSPIVYCIVPEEHKKGGFHIHGLINGLTDEDVSEWTVKTAPSRKLRDKIRSGERIFDIPRFSEKFGFVTASKVKNAQCCAEYVSKYIIKSFDSLDLEEHKHRFFSSLGLERASSERLPAEYFDWFQSWKMLPLVDRGCFVSKNDYCIVISCGSSSIYTNVVSDTYDLCERGLDYDDVPEYLFKNRVECYRSSDDDDTC